MRKNSTRFAFDSKPRHVDTVVKSFADKLQTREGCAMGPVVEQTKEKEKWESGHGFRHGQNTWRPPTTSTLFLNNERPPLNKEMWCNFCSWPHPPAKCAVLTEPKASKRILRQKGRCFGCLRSGHVEQRVIAVAGNIMYHCEACRTIHPRSDKLEVLLRNKLWVAICIAHKTLKNNCVLL